MDARAKWGFLAPWCAALKGSIAFDILYDESNVWTTNYCLKVTLPTRAEFDSGKRKKHGRKLNKKDEEHFHNEFVKFREALALLAAVEGVNYDVWRYLLTECCGIDVGKEGERNFEANIPARYFLSMDWEGKRNKTNKSQLDFDLVEFCGTSHRENPNAEYLEALAEIARLQNCSLDNNPGLDILVPVRVNFPGNVPGMRVGEEQLLDVAKAEREIKRQWEEPNHQQEVAAGSMRCTFVLEPMLVDFVDHNSISTEMGDVFERLVQDNVWIGDVSSLPVAQDGMLSERESTIAFGRVLANVFDHSRRPRDLANTNYHFKSRQNPLQLGDVTVYLNGEYVGVKQIEDVCSAMVVSQTTKNLSISFENSPDEQTESNSWWKWIAYALFSHRARLHSAVESLSFATLDRLSIQDAEAFAAALTSKHLEEELCRRPRGLGGERDATLKAGSPIRWVFDANGRFVRVFHDLSFPKPICHVRVFSDDGSSEWVDALIPGYGRCQVLRGDLTFDELKLNSIEPGASKITSLVVGFPGWLRSDTSGLPHFLATIGPSLTRLTLQGPRVAMDESAILQRCPNLEALSLCGGLIDVELNFSDYRRSNQPLPTLRPIDWHNVVAFAAVLCDANSALTKCVRRLRVHMESYCEGWGITLRGYEPRGYASDLWPLLQMLELNESLEFFEIIVRSKNEYDKYLEEFRKHHLAPIPRAAGPLPTDKKVAFLSVFYPLLDSNEPDKKKPCGAQPQPALRSLGERAFKNIFDFAAPNILRQVYFRSVSKGIGWDDENSTMRRSWQSL